jgi:REP element-mobilizing transposase RayT
MARSRRRLIAGGIYHVTCRGNRKEPIFLSDGDRILLLELVKKVRARRRWLIHGYCLMQNHYHLLLETPEADLSAGMQTINGEYAQWFNRDYGFVGHVFQGRFHAVLALHRDESCPCWSLRIACGMALEQLLRRDSRPSLVTTHGRQGSGLLRGG